MATQLAINLGIGTNVPGRWWELRQIPEQGLADHGRPQGEKANQLCRKLTRMKKTRDVLRERPREGPEDPTMPRFVLQPIDMSLIVPVVQRALQLSTSMRDQENAWRLTRVRRSIPRPTT